ncbi:MAG: glycosyltransferase family 4 protein [Candidatus Omnitrophota bacterium]
MKVLLLTTHLNTGGIAVYTVSLARYLKKAGVDVTVASGGGDMKKVLVDNIIPHLTLDIKTKSEFGLKVWKASHLLSRMVKAEGFDIVHAQTRVAQVLGCLVERKTGVPFISTCHGFFKHHRLGRKLFPCWGRKVIAISDSVRKHLIGDFRLPGDRVQLVYNGVETGRYSDIGEKDDRLLRNIGLSKEVLLVGAVGRLSPVKGLNYLVSAFKKAMDRDSRMQLLLVGEGPEKASLEEQVLREGVSDNVFFASGKEAPLGKFLLLMDIFCLPSVSEGLGLSLMEAMAAGRACVASSIGGPVELITPEEDGILVPPKDPEALSRGIMRLAEDDQLRKRIGQEARKKALSEFSIEDSVRKTINVYEKVVTK